MASTKQYADAIKKIGLKDNQPIVKSVPKVVELVGEDLNGESIRAVYEAEPVAFPELKLAATSKGVKQGRLEGLRMERIAARTGLTVAEVKDFAEKEKVGEGHWLGIGRRPGNGNGTSAPAKKASSGRRGSSSNANTAAAASGTSGRRSSAAKSKSAPAKARGRRGTRAAANPK